MVTSFYHGEKNHYGFFTQVSNLILQSTNEKESIPDAEHEGEDSTALPDSETSHDAIDETNCVNAEQTNETAD